MSSSREVPPRTRLAWRALVVLLAVETVGGVVVMIPVLQGLFGESAAPLGQRISIILAAVIAWVWVAATLWGALRARASWVRGSAITIHVLLFAAGTGILQLQLADILMGWALVLLAFAGFAAAIVAKPLDTEPTGAASADSDAE